MTATPHPSSSDPDWPPPTRFAVSSCPICEAGLRLVRACGFSSSDANGQPDHGLVVCDECEAIWLHPDVNGPHVYPDPESPACPLCQSPLYDGNNRWATRQDLEQLHWSTMIDESLTMEEVSPSADPRPAEFLTSTRTPHFPIHIGSGGSTRAMGNGRETWQKSLNSLVAADADPVEAGVTLQRLAKLDSPDIGGWIHTLAHRPDPLHLADPAILGGLLRLIHIKTLNDAAMTLPTIKVDDLDELISRLPPETPNRHLLVQLLAKQPTEASLRALVRQLKRTPPRGWMAAGQILSPLMQSGDWPANAVFPSLLDCLDQPALAAPILDLANFLVHRGRVKVHPATDRVAAINQLLRGVAGRLGQFEEDPRSFGEDVAQVQAVLHEAVALAVSLCDAVGLIGQPSSIAPLHQALDLKHRRVQCEAAGALARFGESVGAERLCELASEPSARLRAIAYADELGIGERIDPIYREPSAAAEAEMALWLSQPQQMGVPPTQVEVIDSKRLLWPSFDDPVDVFLVRYQYAFGDRIFSNVGMTGPAVFSLACDVADLPPEDIYAIYAGWHVQHDQIFSVAAKEFNPAQRRLAEQLMIHLDRQGYDAMEPKLLGVFLDETAVVYAALRNGTACLVITDGLETIDLAVAGRQRPVSQEDLFHLYKGRKMLRTFNPTVDP